MKGSDLAREASRIADVPLVFSDDLPRDLPRAKLFVYLTRSEGLGSAALLAMACGAPVVASRVGGLAEVIEDGRSGLLVDNAPSRIAAAMRQVLDDPELSGRLAEAGRRAAEERFSTDTMVDGMLRVYEQVVR
jgi:glycosyltransferase involved in cell wall biosynthesis